MKALLQKLKAAETLAALGHLEAKGNLSHRELHKRDQCMATLVEIGPAGVPLLVRKLANVSTSDPTASVPQILERIGDPAVACLARAMHHKNRQLRQNAILLLGRIATPAAVSALDDESVDLMDMEAVRQAQHEAGRHGHAKGSAELEAPTARIASGPHWLPGHDGPI